MKQYVFLFLTLYIPAFLLAQSPRPNILFIMSDDHAAQAVSCYGGKLNQTPNLDRIAQQGMRFDKAYCTNSICAPVRAAILTGKLSHRNGVLDNLYPFDGSQPTAPKMLQQAGYQTAMIGKWHLKSAPTGFDYWKILPGQGHYYNPDFKTPQGMERIEGYTTTLVTDMALDWLENCDTSQPFFMMLHHKAPHRNWMPEMKYLNLFDSIDIPEPPTLFDDYQNRSVAASQQEMSIANHMSLVYDLKVWSDPSENDPWFRQYTENFLKRLTPTQREAVMSAYAAKNAQFLKDSLSGKDLVRWKYQRYIKDYLRCIQSVDDQVGRVLDYLERSGLAENTLVIYTSDQGFYLGEHGWYDKRFIYEESYRQPLLVQWPKKIPAGAQSDALVMNVDLTSTFLDVAGVSPPEDMQGKSLQALFRTGQAPPFWRDATYYHYYEYPAVHAVKRHYGLRTKRYKLAHFYYDIDAWEMFDMEKDPLELNNVFENPAYLNVRRSLLKKLQELQEYYGERPEDYLAPLMPNTTSHLARTAACKLVFPPDQCHSPDTARFLVDGEYRMFSPYNAIMREGYGGFRKNHLEVILDFGAETAIQEAGLHCRQLTQSWIHYPTQLQLFASDDGQTFRQVAQMEIPPEEPDGSRWITAQDLNLKTRYLKIVAAPKALIPDGLPGKGQKGWLFVDEVFAN